MDPRSVQRRPALRIPSGCTLVELEPLVLVSPTTSTSSPTNTHYIIVIKSAHFHSKRTGAQFPCEEQILPLQGWFRVLPSENGRDERPTMERLLIILYAAQGYCYNMYSEYHNFSHYLVKRLVSMMGLSFLLSFPLKDNILLQFQYWTDFWTLWTVRRLLADHRKTY